MPNKFICYNTTRQWNPGDEFILFGCQNLCKAVFNNDNLYSLIYNRNPDVRPMNGITQGLRNIRLSNNYTDDYNFTRYDAWLRIGFNDNSIKFNSDLSFCDLAIFAGTPEWISHRCTNFFEHILKNKLPTLILGIGWIGNVDAFMEEVIKKTYLFTVRSRTILENDLVKKYNAIWMPCPALYCVDIKNEKKISTLKKCAIVLGTPWTVPFAGIDKKTFNFTVETAHYLVNKYKNIEFKFIAHYIDDIPALTNIFSKDKVIYHYNSQTYFDIYREFDLVLSTRVYGCGIAASLGIPNINIAHDMRADTCEGFLSEIINPSYTQTEIDQVFSKYLDDSYITKSNTHLIQYKHETFRDYIKLIAENIPDKTLPKINYRENFRLPGDNLPPPPNWRISR
ncbi:polysaccharide pyruvyl transferase family protein [Oxalobacter aliiformigenes]|uniref:polysaccharide pyruvyl transferase family protein n=1 Tax=Oxalobacter aliiformigenes TaxID=2946593 RepID=UPI0022B06365|nr:polysaccharide pyruvyl transferase family protein [Oxalobacter aliiformigenes]MCZ4064441.1 polysaccharide pyruvyl transferase family protein [Oxalobacter aliiformigenes]WAV99785.1 polysaccharide pyruvyl transferase family protein [Oxalobacter aliiformigenes]